MAANEQQLQFQQLLQGIDFRYANLLLSALGVRGPMPALLSPGRSINLCEVVSYEPIERINTESIFFTLTGELISDIDTQLNNAKQNETDEILIVSELRFVPAPASSDAPGLWVIQVQRIISTPTGEFDAAITLSSGEQMILAEDENEVFRSNWMALAAVANEFLSIAANFLPADNPENTDEISSEVIEV